MLRNLLFLIRERTWLISVLSFWVWNWMKRKGIVHFSISGTFLRFLLYSKTFSIRGVDGIVIESIAKIVSQKSLPNAAEDVLIIIGQHVLRVSSLVSYTVQFGYVDLPDRTDCSYGTSAKAWLWSLDSWNICRSVWWFCEDPDKCWPTNCPPNVVDHTLRSRYDVWLAFWLLEYVTSLLYIPHYTRLQALPSSSILPVCPQLYWNRRNQNTCSGFYFLCIKGQELSKALNDPFQNIHSFRFPSLHNKIVCFCNCYSLLNIENSKIDDICSF